MKKILLILSLCCCNTVFVTAQTKSVKSFYDRYANDENAIDISVQGWILKLAGEFADDDEAGKVLQKITQLRVLLMEDGNPVSAPEYDQLKRDVRKDQYEELLQIREEETYIDFYIREEGEYITNVLMLVNESDGFVLLSLEGLLKMEDLQNIHLDTEGSEHFKKIGKKKKKKIPQA